MMETKESGWRRGWVVFAILAVLTAVEFGISIGIANPLPWLTIVAIAKGGLIIAYFMRLGEMTILWRKETGE